MYVYVRTYVCMYVSLCVLTSNKLKESIITLTLKNNNIYNNSNNNTNENSTKPTPATVNYTNVVHGYGHEYVCVPYKAKNTCRQTVTHVNNCTLRCVVSGASLRIRCMQNF